MYRSFNASVFSEVFSVLILYDHQVSGTGRRHRSTVFSNHESTHRNKRRFGGNAALTRIKAKCNISSQLRASTSYNPVVENYDYDCYNGSCMCRPNIIARII